MKGLTFPSAIRIGDYINPRDPIPNDPDNTTWKWVPTPRLHVGKGSNGNFPTAHVLVLASRSDSIGLVEYSMESSLSGAKDVVTAFFLCGFDSSGNELVGQDDYRVAPCPPFCTGGNTVSANESPDKMMGNVEILETEQGITININCNK